MRFEFGGHLEKTASRAVSSTSRASDALVFFGATGDLAYKKIFPALQAMAERGHLDVPVIGVAKARLGPRAAAQARAATASTEARRRSTTKALRPSCSTLLRYVDGDYARPGDLRRLHAGARAAPSARCTTWPSRRACSRRWSSRSAQPGCARGRARRGREAVRPRPGLGARAQRAPCTRVFAESAIFRIDHYLGKEPVAEPALLPLRQLVPRADLEPQLRRERADHDGRELRRGRAAAGSTRRPAPSAT